jgi:hypothetical protein
MREALTHYTEKLVDDKQIWVTMLLWTGAGEISRPRVDPVD